MGSKTIDVVIETPRGSRNKYKYDPKLDCFRLGSVLPAGMDFPYDFGFVPGTKALDGDPLDALILMDKPAYPGVVLTVRLIGAIEAEQREDGNVIRNDRIIGVAEPAHDYQHIHTLADVNPHLLKELENFFISYNRMRGKKFKLLGTCSLKGAWKLVQKSKPKARKRQKR